MKRKEGKLVKIDGKLVYREVTIDTGIGRRRSPFHYWYDGRRVTGRRVA